MTASASKETKIDKLWLLKAYPKPHFVPKCFEIVKHVPSGRNALVVTTPADPDPETFDIDALGDDQVTRPCRCNILLGEEYVVDVDVSKLESLNSVDDDADEWY